MPSKEKQTFRKYQVVQLYVPRIIGSKVNYTVISQKDCLRMDRHLRYVCSIHPEDGLGNDGSYDIFKVSAVLLDMEPGLNDYVALPS